MLEVTCGDLGPAGVTFLTRSSVGTGACGTVPEPERGVAVIVDELHGELETDSSSQALVLLCSATGRDLGVATVNELDSTGESVPPSRTDCRGNVASSLGTSRSN